MKSIASLSTSTPPTRGQQNDQVTPEVYWSLTPEQLLSNLHTSSNGLQPADAEQRLKQYGLNVISAQQQATALRLLLSQFKSPLVLILIFAAIISGIVGEWVDAIIVVAIVLGSTILGFVQEYNASNAVARLRSQVTVKSRLLRGGQPQMLPSEQVVPGDVVILSAGSLIPADGIVLEADDFFINQAVLTGETFPVEKNPSDYPRKCQPGAAYQLCLHGHECQQWNRKGFDCSDRKNHSIRPGGGTAETAPTRD